MKQTDIRSTQGGFSLLEAIVALVLLSTSGMALFSWINNNLSGLNHALEIVQKSQYRKNALALMQQINPALEQKGQTNLGDFTVIWQAVPITPMKHELTLSGAQGPYLLGLFETKITVSRLGAIMDEFTLRQIGYQPNR